MAMTCPQRVDCAPRPLAVNNIDDSSRNQGFDSLDSIEGVPVKRVVQFHRAGHFDYVEHLIDTHDQPVAEAVYLLCADALARSGPFPTLLNGMTTSFLLRQ